MESPTAILGNEQEFWIGRGPLAAWSEPKPGSLAFLSPDFSEDPDRSPWLVPAQSERRPRESAVSARSPLAVRWEAPSREAFAEAFEAIRSLRESGDLAKAVPVTFERGRFAAEVADPWGELSSRAMASPPALYPYGLRRGDGFFVGISPERLVEIEGSHLWTMALAGTAPDSEADRLWRDPKEGAEHDFVVRDILERLRDFGDFAAGERRLRRLPGLVHLETPIEGQLRRAVTPSLARSLVAALHPTAALGVYPRTPSALAWLRQHSEATARGSFGAPFGVWTPEGRFFCVVAIRRVDVRGSELRVGAGCGVVAGSELEREWRELALKRDSVKRRLGLIPGGEGA